MFVPSQEETVGVVLTATSPASDASEGASPPSMGPAPASELPGPGAAAPSIEASPFEPGASGAPPLPPPHAEIAIPRSQMIHSRRTQHLPMDSTPAGKPHDRRNGRAHAGACGPPSRWGTVAR